MLLLLLLVTAQNVGQLSPILSASQTELVRTLSHTGTCLRTCSLASSRNKGEGCAARAGASRLAHLLVEVLATASRSHPSFFGCLLVYLPLGLSLRHFDDDFRAPLMVSMISRLRVHGAVIARSSTPGRAETRCSVHPVDQSIDDLASWLLAVSKVHGESNDTSRRRLRATRPSSWRALR